MEKVLEAPPEPRPERFLSVDRRDLGSILHVGADKLLKAMVENGKWPDTESVVQECLNHEENGVKRFFHLSPSAGDIYKSLSRFVGQFRVEWGMDGMERDAVIRNHMLGNEMRLAATSDGKPCSFFKCPSTGWRGIVDYAEAVDDQLTVIDFKNRPAIFPEAELKADEQLSTYIYLVRCQYPGQYKRFRAGIYYFEFGYTQFIDFDEEQIEDNVNRLRVRARVKERLEEKDIGPEPGYGKCQYCDYLASCDAGKEFLVGGQIAPTDVDQARQTAAWVMVMEEKIKAAKEALKLFTGEFGPIDLDDKTLVGYRAKDGFSYDKNLTLKIVNKLIQEGKIDGKLRDFSSLDLKAVQKLAKRKEIDEALKPAQRPTTKTSFEFFKPASGRGVKVEKQGRKTVERRTTKAQVKGGGK